MVKGPIKAVFVYRPFKLLQLPSSSRRHLLSRVTWKVGFTHHFSHRACLNDKGSSYLLQSMCENMFLAHSKEDIVLNCPYHFCGVKCMWGSYIHCTFAWICGYHIHCIITMQNCVLYLCRALLHWPLLSATKRKWFMRCSVTDKICKWLLVLFKHISLQLMEVLPSLWS